MVKTQAQGSVRRQIIETCLAMNKSGLNHGKSGNVSQRVEDGFLITPSGVAYGRLEEADIVFMDLDGCYEGDLLPSSEWRMHLDIYRQRPEAGAVVHVHSSFATALSCLRRSISAFHYMVAVAGGDDIRCSDYAIFGSQALSEAMLKALEGRKACLLGNHGQIAYGGDLDAALWLAGEVEGLARDYSRALMLGEPHILSGEEMAAVLAKFQTYGKQIEELPVENRACLDMPQRRVSDAPRD